MELNALWFIIIAFFFIGYFVLEGFDFGVGMALPFVGGDSEEANDARRTAAVRSIGPVWDGNEVWLITGGAAIFAAFPEWYATLFSGFYLPLLLILVSLIIRGVCLEWRVKVDTLSWRKRCDLGIIIGSYVPALLWGVAFANIVAGVKYTNDSDIATVADGFFGLLNPLGLVGGLAFLLLFFFHGLLFLGMKTGEPLRSRVHQMARGGVAFAAVGVGAVFLLWIQFKHGYPWTWVPLILVVAFLAVALYALWTGKDGLAFAGTACAIIACGITLFGALFPDVLPSSNGIGGLDIHNAAASPYTLKIMTWAAVVLAPAVLIGQGWTYWQFRKRVTVGAAHSA